MYALVLFFRLLWDPVTVDCHGLPESAVTYEVTQYEARVLGSYVGPDGAVYYDYSRTRVVFSTAATLVTLPDLAEPALNEVTFTSDPVAIDAAGNRSDAPCQ